MIEKTNINIFIIDNKRVVVEGLKAIIKRYHWNVVGEAYTSAAALDQIPKSTNVVIMDINLKGIDGIRLVRKIKGRYPKVKVVVMNGLSTVEDIQNSISAGADGFILKDAPEYDLGNAIGKVMKGERYLCPNALKTLMKTFTDTSETGLMENVLTQKHKLTKREKQVMKLLIEGETNKRIAEKLFLSVRTVETHRKNIMRTAGVKNLGQLINFVHNSGILDY